MTSKYSIANELIEQATRQAADASLDGIDVQEALLVSLVQTLKSARGADAVRSLLQYELDSLGSGGVYEIQKR